MKPILGGLLVVSAVLVATPVRAQIQHTSYETFMRLDDGERPARFAQLTPENQAELQREHLARWRKLRADSLTVEKQKLLDEVAASIRAENYVSGSEINDRHANEQKFQALMDLQRRVSTLFTPDEAFEAFTLRGRLIQAQ